MERTDSSTIDDLKESLERAREASERDGQLRAVTRRMGEAVDDLPAATRAALDGILVYLDFERAFLLEKGPAAAAALPSEGDAFLVLGARAFRRGGTDAAPVKPGSFEDVPNPEFAINRAAVRRAWHGGQALAVADCLAGSSTEGGEVHRSVVCVPFPGVPGKPALLYLDRPLGRPLEQETLLPALEEFSERCLPILSASLLSRELARLRARVPAAPAAGPEEADPAESSLALPAEIPSYQGIVGGCERMRRLFDVIEKVKDSDLNICIFGESGTGKELVARAIHGASRRRDRMFVSENCGTIAENLLESELFGHLKGAFTGADEDRQGLFQVADGGTLFLDEIGDMSEGMQRKLLRVLQEGMIRPIGSKAPQKVDVRVICASNKNLRALVQAGTFRVDLFYRVNVVTLEVPPLRDRMEDLPVLVAHFLREAEREEGATRRLGASAMNAFAKYNWPGNVRELRNVIRRAVVTCPHRTIARKDVLPLLVGGQSAAYLGLDMDRTETEIVLRIPRREGFNEIIDECERVVLENVLKECHWNKSKVVKVLKIPRQSLYNKIAKHGLQRKWQ